MLRKAKVSSSVTPGFPPLLIWRISSDFFEAHLTDSPMDINSKAVTTEPLES